MIDDINISTAIIKNPQMKVDFNTNTRSTRLNRTRIGCFINNHNFQAVGAAFPRPSNNPERLC
ncbi:MULTISPECIES: hypothetical protein [unclassified Nostoc]|uniref:hypothetical protein n=1 Tax=unclassified Nostoc TaxID=2593658 RepID=UPI00114D0D5F|nr:hypothetical protein [Nostoc sp. KVJ20]